MSAEDPGDTVWKCNSFLARIEVIFSIRTGLIGLVIVAKLAGLTVDSIYE
jgi:hypothetical protein